MDFNPVNLLNYLNDDLNRVSSDDEVTLFRIDALKKSILKKYVTSDQNLAFHTQALADFAALNNQVSEFRLNKGFEHSKVFTIWKDILHDFFHSEQYQMPSLTLNGCIHKGRCGPGASIGTTTTSFLEKMFSSSLTSTSASLVSRYRRTIAERWSAAEVIRASLFDTTIVAGSRLSSVPKDNRKNRTICIEPTLNMFYQLGAKTQIESVLLKRCHIDISKQADINKRLALHASIDGSFSTIDLKNASDSISIELCQKLLPKNVMDILMKIRSPVADIGGVTTELHMLSTMGNGFTFPLMTMLFATLIKAISILHDEPCRNGTDFGVFGDDLIARSSLTPCLLRCLKQAGFIVNTEKSFTEGHFRESCGGDFYKGHDVRGIYIKGVNNAGQIYSAFNRLHFWSIRSNVNLNCTLVYLKGLVDFRPVPCDSSVHEGNIITSDHLTSAKRDRNGSIYYRSFGYSQARNLRVNRFETNYHGCLIAFLGGYVSDKRVLCRNDMVCVVERRKTPRWDFPAFSGLNTRELSASWNLLLS